MSETKANEDVDVIEMFGSDDDDISEQGQIHREGSKVVEEDDDRDSDVIEMFGGSDDSGGEGADPMADMGSPSLSPPARKRRKTGRESLDNSTRGRPPASSAEPADDDAEGDREEKERMLTLAKSKLSKWAARLFDPDRPRGLVEPPQTIPLNDEFLEAFGRREKDFDDKTGRETEIDRVDLDREASEGKSEADGYGDGDGDTVGNKRKRKGDDDRLEEGCKVKITNLAYSTPHSTLLPACEKYGPVVDCNLIMDSTKKGSGLSTGRAYVTYESPEYAELAIREMNDKFRLDGRVLRVATAEMQPQRSAMNGEEGKPKRGGGGAPGSGPTRYWEKDISTKCFRCGGVGHMASNCLNPEKARPCPMCAEPEPDHGEWGCPKRTWCFHCGVPGHVSRECPERMMQRGGRGSGPLNRKVCGNCFQSGHHRWQCRVHSSEVLGNSGRGGDFGTDSAKCMQCGRFGHFSCEPLKWFFGLKGDYCFNCGFEGHHGIDCRRPTLDQIGRDKEAAEREIEQVEALALEEELRRHQERSRGYQNGGDMSSGRGRRGRDNEYDYGDRRRARSQPPPEKRWSGSDSGRRDYGDSGVGGGHRRRYSDSEGGSNRHGARKHSDEGRGYQQGGGGRSRSRSGGGGSRSRTY